MARGGRKKQRGGSKRKPTTKKGRREEREKKEEERERREEEELEKWLAEKRRIQGERELAEMSEFSLSQLSLLVEMKELSTFTFSCWILGGRFERLEEERVLHLEEVEEAKVKMEVFNKENEARIGVGGEEGGEETASVVSLNDTIVVTFCHHQQCHLTPCHHQH